jgi:hypothetical protein
LSWKKERISNLAGTGVGKRSTGIALGLMLVEGRRSAIGSLGRNIKGKLRMERCKKRRKSCISPAGDNQARNDSTYDWSWRGGLLIFIQRSFLFFQK